MAKFELDRIDALVKGLTTARLLDSGALAGTGLVAPLVTLRARSARRDLTRLEMRDGPESDTVKRQTDLVAVLDSRSVEIVDDLERRLGPQVEAGADEAVIDGRVMQRGKAVAAATVSIGVGDKGSSQAVTGRDGRFSIAIPAGADVRLAVAVGDQTIFRDDNALAYPAGYRAYRTIDLDDAGPVRDDGVPDEGSVEVPMLIGDEREKAEKRLAEAGLKIGRVTLVAGKVGVIVGQAPKAGAKVKLGDAVALRVGKGEDRRTLEAETKNQ